MEESQIHDESLILRVSKRRSLWDQKSFDYLNRELKSKDWENVAQEMNSTVEQVKTRWRYLKDTFNREIRIMAPNRNSKWIHFDQMSFLLQGFNTLLLPSSFLSKSLNDIDQTHLSATSLARQEDTYSISSNSKRQKTNHSNNTSGVFSSISNFHSTPMAERSESVSAKAEFGNEDYYFLMSLLPTFEKMAPRQKLLVKIKMMQDVFDASFGDPVIEISDCSKNGSMD